MAAGSSQLAPHRPPPIPRGPGLPQVFRLELGPTGSWCIPFVLKIIAKKERSSDEPILSPIPTFLAEEWEIGWNLYWNKGRRMLVILIIKNNAKSLVWSAYLLCARHNSQVFTYITHLVFTINPMFYTGELRHKEMKQPARGHTTGE